MNGNKREILTAVFGGALALSGCSDSDDGGGTATVQLDLQVIEFEPGADTDPPFEGAEVCVADTTNCGTSDGDGMVTLQIPANSERELLVTAEGYGPTPTPCDPVP